MQDFTVNLQKHTKKKTNKNLKKLKTPLLRETLSKEKKQGENCHPQDRDQKSRELLGPWTDIINRNLKRNRVKSQGNKKGEVQENEKKLMGALPSWEKGKKKDARAQQNKGIINMITQGRKQNERREGAK